MMKRGDIYFANLDPTIGSEIKKTRPVLIVSNDANNHSANIVTVVPLTSNTTKVCPFDVLLEENDSGLKKRSKAQCNQIRIISKLRIQGRRAGVLKPKKMVQLKSAIMLHLGFD